MVFFCCKNIIRKEGMVFEMKIIKQELEFEECLKQRLEFICEFFKVSPTFINGNISNKLSIVVRQKLYYYDYFEKIILHYYIFVYNECI